MLDERQTIALSRNKRTRDLYIGGINCPLNRQSPIITYSHYVLEMSVFITTLK